jgi:hypothetical protein
VPSPERYAEHIAPLVDRVHAAAHDLARVNGAADLVRGHALPHVGLLITLRFVLLRGPLPRDAFPLADRYSPAASTAAAVDDLMAAGHLRPDPAPLLRPGPAVTTFLTDLYDLHATVLAADWLADLADAVRITGALLAAAVPTGGPAFSPPYERPADPPGVVLFNRLAALRYHRSDAHAAAWSARGRTAPEIRALPPHSTLRQQIEADTNTRAAPPYATLTPADRSTLHTTLTALLPTP